MGFGRIAAAVGSRDVLVIDACLQYLQEAIRCYLKLHKRQAKRNGKHMPLVVVGVGRCGRLVDGEDKKGQWKRKALCATFLCLQCRLTLTGQKIDAHTTHAPDEL
jgi:hypothetical protein